MVKCSWSDSQSSSGDVIHVFMSSFSEAADANITGSIPSASVRVVNKPVRLRHTLKGYSTPKLTFCNNSLTPQFCFHVLWSNINLFSSLLIWLLCVALLHKTGNMLRTGAIYKTVTYTNNHRLTCMQTNTNFKNWNLWCFFQDLLMNKLMNSLFKIWIVSNNISLYYYFLLI